MDLHPFSRVLAAMGFLPSAGDGAGVIFQLRRERRIVLVQLRDNGRHSVFSYTVDSRRASIVTGFESLEVMVKAVNYELTRKDFF